MIEELWLSYCGDTSPAIFDLEPRLFTSRILMLECTFLGEAYRERGHLYKHLHLEDIAATETIKRLFIEFSPHVFSCPRRQRNRMARCSGSTNLCFVNAR